MQPVPSAPKTAGAYPLLVKAQSAPVAAYPAFSKAYVAGCPPQPVQQKQGNVSVTKSLEIYSQQGHQSNWQYVPPSQQPSSIASLSSYKDVFAPQLQPPLLPQQQQQQQQLQSPRSVSSWQYVQSPSLPCSPAPSQESLCLSDASWQVVHPSSTSRLALHWSTTKKEGNNSKPQPQPTQSQQPSAIGLAGPQIYLQPQVYHTNPFPPMPVKRNKPVQILQNPFASTVPAVLPVSAVLPAHGQSQAPVRRVRHAFATQEVGEVGAVIVTISQASSYDPIFKDTPQKGDGDSLVAVYDVALDGLQRLLAALESLGETTSTAGLESHDDQTALLEDLQRVPAESVVFNWECCSACGDGGRFFLNEAATKASLSLMKYVMDCGHMVMCSDFSLKALIRHWDAELLGPNPFRNVGVTSGTLHLSFDPDLLKACPSSQLAKVGELCTAGTARIHAMSGTIVFEAVDRTAKEAEENGAFTLQRLTSIKNVELEQPGTSQLPGMSVCRIEEAAGHVLLTYPSGGRLLASAGHWKELVHLDGVSESALIETYARYYGEASSQVIMTQLGSCPDEESRRQTTQTLAQVCVQSSPPCQSLHFQSAPACIQSTQDVSDVPLPPQPQCMPLKSSPPDLA
eukprot:TRINITY_DN9892_c2_g1_i1.p1 TRINITY_DN9892_c2_g1~~TRINITY_DN9892_c2_g1_i1.p1  ORF type:complete len:626 (+),score=122.05 TRINITY_DN9892_c2_g1_i1:82-1959(+)